MPRVKPKTRVADRRTECAEFSMAIFDDIAAEISAAKDCASSAADIGTASEARDIMQGGDCLEMLDRVREMQAAGSLKDQLAILARIKAELKSALTNENPNITANISKRRTTILLYQSIEILLRLYLSPEGFVLRKSMDWVSDMMSRATAVPASSMQAIVVRSCEGVLARALGDIRGPCGTSPAGLMSWVHSLNAMGLLDRDVPWLDDADSLMGGETSAAPSWPLVQELGGGSLYLFVRIALLIFQLAATAVIETPSNGVTDIVDSDPIDADAVEAGLGYIEDEVPSSGAVASAARFADCAGETMRVLNIALKARRAAYVAPPDGKSSVSEMWLSLVDGPVLPLAVQLLSSKMIGKDVIASTALGIMCLQWISRNFFLYAIDANAIYTPEIGVSQLGVIIATVRSHYITGAAVVTPRSQQALAAGLNPALSAAMDSLPLDAACGIFRAALNVYSDGTLMARGGIYNDLGCDLEGPVAVNEKEQFLHGGIFRAIMELCIHRVPEIQAAGMQALEAWVNRVEINERAKKQTSFDGLAGHTHVSELARKICDACNIVSRSWSHPLKNINHLVPVIYQRLVDLMSILDAHAAVRQNMGEHEHADIWWSPLIQNALMQPVNHRGRYQALTVLLPRVGAMRFLQSHPQIIASLTQSMRVRDVSSAACALLGNILSAVMKSLPYSEFRNLWEPHLVEAICSSDAQMRTNAVDYLIPEMIKVDPTCCPRLINRVRALGASTGPLTEIKLFAIMHIVLQARLHNVVGQDVIHSVPEGPAESAQSTRSLFSLIASSLYLGTEEIAARPEIRLHPTGPLQSSELTWACLSQDVDLRLTAITAITSSQLALQPISGMELRILRDTIGYSMKTSNADDRHRLLRAVRGLLLRLRDTCRAATRDLKKISKSVVAKRGTTAAVLQAPAMAASSRSKKSKKSEPPLDEFELLKTIDTGHETCKWLSAVILGNLYPGSSSEREVVALELYLLVLDSLGPQESADDAKLLRHFVSADTVKTLVNMLVSAWDRPRKLAAEALTKLPRPLCGVTGTSDVGSLVIWGARLSGSSRQRESDAGALMLRVVMSIYCIHQGWDINVLHPTSIAPHDLGTTLDVDESTPLVTRLTSATAAVRFISGLCDLMAIRLQGLEALFSTLMQQSGGKSVELGENNIISGLLELEEEMSEEASPLCHGLFLVLKYVLEEVCASNLFDVYVPSSKLKSDGDKLSESSAWMVVLSRLLHLSQKGLDLALSVVAEAQTDVSFAPVLQRNAALSPDSLTATADVGLSKGPTNVNSYMFLNTNSFMDNKLNMDNVKRSKGDPELKAGSVEIERDEEGMGTNVQRAVVGAWLLVKESSALLARMVRLPAVRVDVENQDITKTCALSNENIELIGSTLLDALGRLKHLGAIAEAQQALQDICSHLLLLGERNSSLCSLPGKWLEAVLRRLENEQQVFILRRSAGFGYTFIALLKSEPPKNKSVLVPAAVERLLRIANVGLIREGVMTIDSLGLPPDQVEALNAASAIGWRACVHAINVIRLLVLDGFIGPRMNDFIAQAMIVAVRGFVSSRWAVRNSAMMLFSAVIQRSVDVEKRESGGGKAATAAEFFQRYPSLFPFLLKELAEVTSFSVESDAMGRPNGVQQRLSCTMESANSSSGAIHPSLFPILLLLSKFRAPTSSTNANSMIDRGIALFIPLLESCHSNKVFQVRDISARALPSLVPLDSIPGILVDKINSLIPIVRCNRTSADTISSNEVHGKVMQLFSLVSVLRRSIDGATYRMGNNRAVYDGIRKQLADTVLVPMQYLLSALTKLDMGQLCRSARQGSTSVLSGVCNPAVVTLLVRIIGMLIQLIDVEENALVAENLLSALCSCVLYDIFTPVSSDTSMADDLYHLSRAPYKGVLHEEALANIIPVAFKWTLLSAIKEGSKLDAPSASIESTIFPFVESSCMCSCGQSDPVQCTFSVFLNLLDASGSNSEVRRGVLQGLSTVCCALSRNKRSSDAAPVAAKEDILPFLFQHEVLLRLLHRSITEDQPPEALLSIELLCQVLRAVDADDLHNIMEVSAANNVLNLFQASGWAMWHLMKGPRHFSPIRAKLMKGATKMHGGYNSSCFIASKLDYLHSKYFYDRYQQFQEQEDPVVAPTCVAACALEVIGWSICSVFSKFNFAARDSIYTFDEGRHMERSSALLNMWLDMIEYSTDEQMPVFSRLSAVRSISMSKALLWSVEYGLSVLRAHSSSVTEKKMNGLVIGPVHNGEFSCRLWLVVLKLMQDDDIDIRCEMNKSLSAANSKFTLLVQTMQLGHMFYHDNLPTVLKVSETLTSRRKNDLNEFDSLVKCDNDIREIEPDLPKETPMPADLEPAQGRSIECMVPPLAMSVIWSLLCDRVPPPEVKHTLSLPGTLDAASVIAATYGDKNTMCSVKGVLVFIAHRGVKRVLEAFNDIGGGSIQPLIQFVMKESHGESDTQQIFEADQANLHAEALISAAVLSSVFGVVVNALPPTATIGISKFFFSRAESAVSLLQLSMQKLSWIGGPSYQPNVFNFAYCALSAARMLRSSHPASISCEDIIEAEKRLKISCYQLVRRSNQLVTSSGEIVTRPTILTKAKEDGGTIQEEVYSWYRSFSLSRFVSGGDHDHADLDYESNLSEDIVKTSTSGSVRSGSDCDNTSHSETAHLRAPILGSFRNASGLHPSLLFLLHDIILYDKSKVFRPVEGV